MEKIVSILLITMMVAVPVVMAAEDNPEGGRQSVFNLKMVAKCLDKKHGQMLRCVHEGVVSASSDKLSGIRGRNVTKGRWEDAPPEARAEENPYPRDVGSVAKGREFYHIQCAQCHGLTGRGDGAAAGEFGRPMADLAGPETQQHTDGELMWKITEGGWPMPAFGYQEEWGRSDLWHVINFLRSLSFQGTPQQ